ncbi:glycosyltransferase [Thermosulfurimonas dismutans]|uniref:Glycosyltransferase n=1 Tax=Thermosulfurimonas dismutans TaxID=999894 RepID=A0A179D2K9_9BACT|nr:glycosyltransferase [Thermosulfurimonas dismutans]OAQ19868.1 Glycosyltransferase [Thermosulfurimonas dismutans]
MKFFIISHGHPEITKGGGELAAYSHYKGLLKEGHEAYFLARAPEKYLHLGTQIIAFRPREYLFPAAPDLFNLFSHIDLGEDSPLITLLKELKPDVVHFHHYFYIGVDAIYAIKRSFPDTKIVMTLHEYIAICLHNGQMIKPDFSLCYKYSPRDCNECFPQFSPENIFLREMYIKNMFGYVDLFISPSHFLKSRYVEWGIPQEKIVVLENGLPEGERVPPRPAKGVRGRFAYFGQINPYKGVDFLIETFSLLPRSIKQKVKLEIYGTWHPDQSFKERVEKLIKRNRDVVRYHGPYENSELGSLMYNIDWVIMGSIWWENSPLVIQEAFKYGRPVICPDIGGMVEKVKHGYGGLNYRARDHVSLTDLIADIVEGKYDYEDILAKMPSYKPLKQFVREYLDLVAT